MRVGGEDLLVWSFLMALAHGAGLMLLPVMLSQMRLGPTHMMMEAGVRIPQTLPASVILLAVLVHTSSMLGVAGILPLLFFETYEKLGLRLLMLP